MLKDKDGILSISIKLQQEVAGIMTMMMMMMMFMVLIIVSI
jgi:hypothetical protein